MSRFGGLCLVLAACGGGGGFPDAPSVDDTGPPTGTFSVAWSVVDQNSQPLSCDRIAGQTMTVLTHNLAVAGGATQPFSCSTGMGTSEALVTGTYEMNFELAGTFGLLARGPEQVPVEIRANEKTELAPVTFQVEALGGLDLKLATGKAGGNCGPVANGGAGITTVSITLTHNSDGTCQPLQLSISNNGMGTGGGTYMVNCTNPVERACIEADQSITAVGAPSDSYTIRVRGKVGATVCWSNSDTIQVPPLSGVLTRTLNLAQQPGC
jgi:hypothetical protein